MYIMRTTLKSGREYEGKPEIAQYEDATEAKLVLYALRDALGRLNYSCQVVVHTECEYVAAAIEQHWPQGWQENSWKNSRGNEVKNAVLWSMILQSMEEDGHELTAAKGKHEYTEWIQWKLPLSKAYQDTFSPMEEF